MIVDIFCEEQSEEILAGDRRLQIRSVLPMLRQNVLVVDTWCLHDVRKLCPNLVDMICFLQRSDLPRGVFLPDELGEILDRCYPSSR